MMQRGISCSNDGPVFSQNLGHSVTPASVKKSASQATTERWAGSHLVRPELLPLFTHIQVIDLSDRLQSPRLPVPTHGYILYTGERLAFLYRGPILGRNWDKSLRS